ncbi:response regulator [Azoarcus olearius]|uniref:Two-component system regulatory protein n=1 Tax=Azoarcus sp. (strain BH72) TaxID=418699 RepID=A1KAZ2_AZOSB|nr:putative two-component system regulatory protein [Azoarcus olearius]CAL95998.1 putative two-component system regulatory protein [Azoarcus olearius]
MQREPFDPPVMSTERSILLVEDNPADLDLTLRAFRRRHLLNPLLVARDGQEALDFIPRWSAGEPLPLVVLLDLKLPKVPGLEVLRTFKANPLTRPVPVVVLTTSDEDADIESAYSLGANSYILKPVDFDKFTQVASQIELYWCALNKPARQ